MNDFNSNLSRLQRYKIEADHLRQRISELENKQSGIKFVPHMGPVIALTDDDELVEEIRELVYNKCTARLHTIETYLDRVEKALEEVPFK